MNKQDYFFTKDHEWIKAAEGDNIYIIGVTDYAQESLGDIVYVDYSPLDNQDEGAVLDQGEVFCSLESTKTASEVYMPCQGTVLESNSVLSEEEAQYELINSDPYNSGWLIKIKVDSSLDKSEFLTYDEYQQFISAD